MGRSVKHMFGLKSKSGPGSRKFNKANYSGSLKGPFAGSSRYWGNTGTGNKSKTGIASATKVVKGVKNKPKTYSFKKAKYRDVTKQPKPSFMGPFTMKYGKGKSSFPFGNSKK